MPGQVTGAPRLAPRTPFTAGEHVCVAQAPPPVALAVAEGPWSPQTEPQSGPCTEAAAEQVWSDRSA